MRHWLCTAALALSHFHPTAATADCALAHSQLHFIAATANWKLRNSSTLQSLFFYSALRAALGLKIHLEHLRFVSLCFAARWRLA
jgi:hypothetical protein